ncbi:MAG TPA: hypothetical protein VGN17_26775 [Bryobacteraceae bacterium]|jgi:hypothetical protein
MARGYFGRLVWGAGGTALRPSRPVSNLWKSARMDAPAVEVTPDNDAAASPVEAPLRRARPAVTPEAMESKPVPATPVKGSRGIRDIRTVTVADKPPPAGRGERRQERIAITPVKSQAPKQDHTPIREGDQPEPQAAVAVSQSPTPEEAPRPTPKLPYRPQLEPVRVREQVAPVRAEAREADAPAARRVRTEAASAAPLATMTPTRNVPLRIEEPVRHRERTLREASAQEDVRAASKNSIQIGKIEVQVVSPPVPVRYVAAPAAPKGRLARGYTLWSAWQ